MLMIAGVHPRLQSILLNPSVTYSPSLNRTGPMQGWHSLWLWLHRVRAATLPQVHSRGGRHGASPAKCAGPGRGAVPPHQERGDSAHQAEPAVPAAAAWQQIGSGVINRGRQLLQRAAH